MKEYIEKSEAVERALYTPIMSSGAVCEKDRDAWTDGAIDAQEQIAKSIGEIPAADVVERDDLARVQVAHDKVGQALNVVGAFYAQGYHDAMTDHNLVERKRGEWEHRVESHHDTHTDEYWDEGYFVCSECGESWWDTTNFCPNCGCKMVGDADGRD